ncbi:MAG: ATP-binding protein [Oscillospiraceae bacterium]|nr:ATP-binding protein [Oscillospiraceae bacterium]
MIRNPSDLNSKVEEKRIRMLIAGFPGIGKSTLALSAPRPLHIDVDFGIDRIAPRYRVPYIQPRDYQEILDDLKPENLTDFDTLVFDTGGKLISLMSIWAIKREPKYGKRDGSLSLPGYGFIGKEFVRLMDYCFYELRKNIIMVFHAVEEKDGDNTKLRIKVEGQTKNNVWEPMDLGGFMEMVGQNRTIGFSNCERYFAKGTRGVSGVMRIPELDANSPNDFLTKLFATYNKANADEVAKLAAEKEHYNSVMAQGRELIANIEDAATANAAMSSFKALDSILTSKRELNVLWNQRIKKLGLQFDAPTGAYMDKEDAIPNELPAPAQEGA